MDIADFEKRFVTTSRLLRRKKIEIRRSRGRLDAGQIAKSGTAQICGTDAEPMMLISLDKLEGALRGVRDTGTWGDYFESPFDGSDDEVELVLPRRGGRAEYKLDIDRDEDGKD